MKTVTFNGYIDTEVWWGDEVTPQMLHDQLYEGDTAEDATIVINSYGGSCDAAVAMFEDIRAYPGNVTCQVQVAASAATIVSMAGDTVTMSPVGIFMIHRPLTFAYGNEDDMQGAIDMLRSYMNAIMNAYEPRCSTKGVTRDQIAEMMKNEKWMDANEALKLGFIDSVSDVVPKALNSATGRVVDQSFAKDKYDAWCARERSKGAKDALEKASNNTNAPTGLCNEIMAELSAIRQRMNDALDSKKNTVPADQLMKRLNLLKK